MCGIIGGFTNNPISSDVISESLLSIRHRGPDSEGFLQDGNSFIGNRRLSIIDIAGGQQPIFNEDRSIAVVFNGEIYNYLELIPLLEGRGHIFRTKSDTETLVHLWEEYGVNMCSHLRGMFAFCIYDSNQRSLFLGRDRFGKKPCYYTYSQDGNFLFASELKALKPLMISSGASWAIEETGIYDYLSLGCVPEPSTVIGNVSAIPPASWILYSDGKLTMRQYWELEDYGTDRIVVAESLETIRNKISEAVKLRLRSDVPLGVFLSGGLDSSIVAYEASKFVKDRLRCFTIKVNSPQMDESEAALLTASFLNVKSEIICPDLSMPGDLERLVSIFDQPFADPSAVITLKIAEQTSKSVKVVLTGDGGDELFLGYRRHLASFLLSKLDNVPRQVGEKLLVLLSSMDPKRRSAGGFLKRFLRTFVARGGERYLALTSDMLFESDKMSFWRGNFHRPTEGWIESILGPNLAGSNQQIRSDMKINLLSGLLVKMDMTTMSVSLEARSPLLDHELAELAYRQPVNRHAYSFTTKPLLRKAYKGILPDHITNAPKKGFEIPLGSLLQNEWKEMLRDTVGSTNAMILSYLDRQFVTQLLAWNTMKDRNLPYILYSLLMLELWLRRFSERGV